LRCVKFLLIFATGFASFRADIKRGPVEGRACLPCACRHTGDQLEKDIL